MAASQRGYIEHYHCLGTLSICRLHNSELLIICRFFSVHFNGFSIDGDLRLSDRSVRSSNMAVLCCVVNLSWDTALCLYRQTERPVSLYYYDPHIFLATALLPSQTFRPWPVRRDKDVNLLSESRIFFLLRVCLSV